MEIKERGIKMQKRVVITGIGPITAIGTNNEEFFTNIYAMKTNIEHIPESYGTNYTYSSKYRVPAPEISLTDIGLSKVTEKMMSWVSKYTVAGTKAALEDAGFKVVRGEKYFDVEGIKDAKVIIGLGLSSIEEAFKGRDVHISGTGKFNKMVIPSIMTNSAAAWISIIYGIEGESYTLNASCASGTMAVGKGFEDIRDGKCKIAVTGGAEYMRDDTGSAMRGFDVLGVLTKSENGIPMPFSEKRSGFLFNDGAACILVLEELEHALARGAEIYAEIVDFASNSDAVSIVQIDESGRKIKEIFYRLSENKKIDYINGHGTGTELNDRIECEVIRELFGGKESAPYLNSTKGLLGHSIGASGALEAAVTAYSIKNDIIHGNLLEEPLENLNLPLKTIKTEIDYAISVSYGFGGHNGGLLLRKYRS